MGTCPPLPDDARGLMAQRQLDERDRCRLSRHGYDPYDLVPDKRDRTITVSDAGLDRGPVQLLQQLLDVGLEGTRNTRYDTESAQPHLKNYAQTPLDTYHRRHLLSPGDSAQNKAFWRAGRRLRRDWTLAGYQPKVIGSLATFGASAGPTRARDASDAALDALERLVAALREVNPIPRLCVVAVCCVDQTAADWAKPRAWPKTENAIDVLRVGLDTLESWYRREGSFKTP